MKILKVSPKGQITIPKEARKLCNTGGFSMEMKGGIIILKPLVVVTGSEFINFKVESKEETENFAALGKKSFDFWENEKDDIYQKFYKTE